MVPCADLPPIRACLFDLDGLLLNTEDIYAECIDILLKRHGKPKLPSSVKARMQGRPGHAANSILYEWAQLPIPDDDFAELSALQHNLLPTAEPLPGVLELLKRLRDCGLHLALATSSQEKTFRLKTDHLSQLVSFFPEENRILGDDGRLGPNRGKPLPDIFLLALQSINSALMPSEGFKSIRPEECLVFEDSVAGVEAARRAGMRVIWCPHPQLKKALEGHEAEVLAGRKWNASDMDVHQLDQSGDGWGECLLTLESFPYEKYGFIVST
ncbi:hypothetical protein EsDP_00003274 [Epichloe bromicola]|uniref:Haloacid dehalogenase-like hydrolase n=1 Tax=Epichloe bromicola TaxID=79588 RepID=A0ABQ0CNC2_9HYPO